MKTLSILLTCALFVGAGQLAVWLKRAGALPADRPAAVQTLTPATLNTTVSR